MNLLKTLSETWGIVVIPWLVLIIFSLIRRQSLFNCFLSLVAVGSTLFFICLQFGDYAPCALLIMCLLISLLLLVVPIMLMYNGKEIMTKEGRSLPNMLSFLMGVAIAIGEFCFIFFFIRISEGYRFGLLERITGFIGFSAFYFCVVFLSFMFYAIFVSHIPFFCNFKYIIIHGCGLIDGRRISKLLSQRCDTAINVYNKSKTKPLLIPSGGKGDDENISEAEAMADYLEANGIPSENIIREDQSTSTETNLINSKKIIDKMGYGRTALVSSNYHVYRCLRLAKQAKLKCIGIGSPVAKYYWPSALIREFVGVISEVHILILLLIGYAWIPLTFLINH